MNAPALRYQVTADDKASATFRRIRAEMDAAKDSTAQLSRIIGPLGPQLAGAFTVAAIGSWVKRTVEGVDALNDLADATGDSVENLSALEDVALRTGTSMDTAGAAIIKLNKALIEGARDPKSDAAIAIKNLGLEIKDLLALSPVERLQAVGRALNSFGGENKLAYNLTLLGKSTREMAPLLKDLAEAGKLQATVTTQQAEEAEKLRKEWFALEKSALDLSRALAGPVVTALNQVIGAFHDTDNMAGELTGSAYALAVPLQTVAVLGVTVFDVFRGVGTEIGGISAQAVALASGNLAAVRAIRTEMVADADAASKRYDELIARIMNVRGAANDAQRRIEDRGFTRTSSLPKPEKTGEKRKADIDDNTQALASYVQGLSRAIEAEKDLSAEQQAGSFLKSLGVTGQISQVRELVLGLAAEKDMREDLAAQAKLDAAARSAIAAKQLADQEQLNRLLGQTETGKEQERLRTILLINKAFDDGLVTLAQWVELTALLEDNTQELKKTTDEWSVFADQAARNIQDALGDSLEAAMQGNFRSIGDGFKRMIDRMVAEALAAKALKALIGDFGSTGQVGGWVGELFQGAASSFGGGRAGGGPVAGGMTYLVGERGIEVLHMGQGTSGTVTPGPGRGARGGSGMTYAPVFRIAANVDRRSIAQVEAAAYSGALRAYARNS